MTCFGHLSISFRRPRLPVPKEADRLVERRVSVVIPSYQNAPYIERTIDSVLAQTFTDFELIVSDHSSTDGTWEVLQRYATDPRVALLRTPSGGGAVANWNRVSDQARGSLIKLLPGDDVLYPRCLELQVAALDEHPEAVVASVRRDLIDPADGLLLRGRGHGDLHGLVSGERAVKSLVRSGTNLLGEPGCVLMRTAVLRELGGWSDDFPYLIDQVTYMRALQHGDLVALDEVAAAFRVSDTQWSVRLAREQARQAHGAHGHFHELLPGTVTRSDLLLGNIRASLTAGLRRLAYAAWRRRMTRTPGH